MAEWDGNESSCSCNCGFDIPKGGTLDKLNLKTPLSLESGGTGVTNIEDLRIALGVYKLEVGETPALGNTASGTYQDETIYFHKAFISAPIVVIGFKSSSTGGTFGRCSVAVVEVTESYFTFRFFNGDSSNRNPDFTWIAAGI